MKLSVISPTYNEAQNVPLLLRELNDLLRDIDYEVIISDDDSPDLTWARAEEIAKDDSRIRVLRRTRDHGLGSSVIDGFGCATGDAVACIDADMQHDPSILPAMLAELERGADVVVGSRYTAGGSTGNWNWTRTCGSSIATKLAQSLLGIRMSDPMSGYFMLRRDDFLRVRHRLNGDGFKILLELMAHLNPDRVREVPYVFRRRVAGYSKLSRKVILAYIRQLWRLSFLERLLPAEFLKFAVVGASGIVVNLAVMELIVLTTDYRGWRASVIASLAATVNNYILNNLWTFRDRAKHGLVSILKGYLTYLTASLTGLGAATMTYIALTSGLGKLMRVPSTSIGRTSLLVCQFLGILVGIFFNYKLNVKINWKQSSAASKAATS